MIMAADVGSWGLSQLTKWSCSDDAVFQLVSEELRPLTNPSLPLNPTGDYYIKYVEDWADFDKHLVLKASRMHERTSSNTFSALGGQAPSRSQSSRAHVVDGADVPFHSSYDDSEFPERCQSPDVTSKVVSGKAGGSPTVMAADIVSSACLHALLGSTAVIPKLLSGTLCTSSIRPLALQHLLQPISLASAERAQLDAFVQQHGLPSLHSTVDATQHAFVRAVSTVLQHHTSYLQTIMLAIELRRQNECPLPDDDAHPVVHLAPTPLEILQHTQQLRKQVSSLARLCWCYAAEGTSSSHLRWQVQPFPSGNSLLEHICSGAHPVQHAWKWYARSVLHCRLTSAGDKQNADQRVVGASSMSAPSRDTVLHWRVAGNTNGMTTAEKVMQLSQCTVGRTLKCCPVRMLCALTWWGQAARTPLLAYMKAKSAVLLPASATAEEIVVDCQYKGMSIDLRSYCRNDAGDLMT
jgi:hypothetical protein